MGIIIILMDVTTSTIRNLVLYMLMCQMQFISLVYQMIVIGLEYMERFIIPMETCVL